MLTEELVAQLHNLSRIEKLRVLQMLINDLIVDEEAASQTSTQRDVIGAAHDAFGAARALQKLLNHDQPRLPGLNSHAPSQINDDFDDPLL